MSESVNTAGSGIQQEAPASNPGSDDPTGGIPPGSGGVSACAYVMSPVPSEQSAGGGLVGTVKSLFTGLSLGGGEEEKSAEDVTSGSTEATAAAAAAAAVAASAGAAGTMMSGDGGGKEEEDSTTSNASDQAQADGTQKDQEGSSSSTSKLKDHQEHASSGHADSKKSPGAVRENNKAIPVAGGERLGERHWGESSMVPDLPPKRDSQAGGQQQVSSAEGQPDTQTQSNTSANTGGAKPPPGYNNAGNEGGDEGGGEGKTKLMDKVKDKLHMNK